MGNQLWPGAVWSTHFRFLNLLARDLRGLANINLYFSFVNVWNRPETLASLLRWASWSKNSGVIWMLRRHTQFYIWCALFFQLGIISINLIGNSWTSLQSSNYSHSCIRERERRTVDLVCEKSGNQVPQNLRRFLSSSVFGNLWQTWDLSTKNLQENNFGDHKLSQEMCASAKKTCRNAFRGASWKCPFRKWGKDPFSA